MKTINYGKATIVCRYEKTRYGFRHLADLTFKGDFVASAKRCYYNRTWESSEYESVLRALLEKDAVKAVLNARQRKGIMDKAAGRARSDLVANMRSVAGIAALGDILTSGRKESNDWKTRMLKAGLPGLDVPADWDLLSEEEKAARLDKVIAFAREQ